MSQHTYLDIHVIQAVPPSNLNRDDAGTPKQAIYGGATRARVSSQAWKRATRVAFAGGPQGRRTKRAAALLADRIAQNADDSLGREQALRLAKHLLKPLGISTKEGEDETAVLLFVGLEQIERAAALVAGQEEQLAALSDAELDKAMTDLPVLEELNRAHPIDVALFGRMVADLAHMNVDAACQVAHAISTHAVQTEFDYYTAVDDLKDREAGDDAGAGMIGTVEFNSATLYRYANVDLDGLVANLDGDASVAIEATGTFLDAFCRSMPTGKQNSFANRTVPAAVVVAIREDQPVNLVTAFEQPLGGRTGHTAASIDRLAAEFSRVDGNWVAQPLALHASYDSGQVTPDTKTILGDPEPFTTLVGTVRAALADRLEQS